MKKLLPLLLCILLLCGCSETYDGPTVAKPVLTEYYVKHLSPVTGNFWEDRTVFSYDIYGNMVRRMEYTDGELQRVYKYTYDDRGNELSQVCWNHEGWIPYPESRDKTTYDEQGRVLTRVSQDFWGRETGRSTYTYDDENHTKTWESSSGDQVIYYYDGNGVQLRDVSTGIGGTYETVYQYDDRGNRTGWTSTKDGEYFNRYEAGYDDQNRQTWGELYDENGELLHRTTYTYDDETNTTTIHKPNGITRVEHYHEDGRLHMIEDYNEEGDLALYQQYTYRDIQVPADREE